MAERIVYVEWSDPCCVFTEADLDGRTSVRHRSQEQLIAEKAEVATIYLADEDAEVWGDDWNDAPACCNSGAPYEHGKYGPIRKVVLRYGEPWPSAVLAEAERDS